MLQHSSSSKESSEKAKSYESEINCDLVKLTVGGGITLAIFRWNFFFEVLLYSFPSLFAGVSFLTKSQTANTKTGILGLN